MISYSERRDIAVEQILPIYRANKWSSANVPEILHQALLNSHSLVTAWDRDKLVGIGNAISDGFLVVYYPHLLVHPDYQRQGIGKKIMSLLQKLTQSEFNIVEILQPHATSQGEDTAYVFLKDGENKEIRLTYQELDLQAKRSFFIQLTARYQPSDYNI